MILCGHSIGHIIYCEVCHFGLGFAVAFVVFWWTRITLLRITSRSYYTTSGFPHRSYKNGFRTISDRFIRNFSLSLALSFAVFSHVFQDYTLNLF